MADHAEDLLPPRERHGEKQREASGAFFTYLETTAFGTFAICAEIFFVTIYSIWFSYIEFDLADENYNLIYGGFRDVNIMIFFGFGYLMTFPRRYGYSAVGLAFLISAFVCQWSLILEAFFTALDQEFHIFGERWPIGVTNCLNALFCAGAVMISFGAILGKTTPLQMIVLGFIEPIFYWLNIFVCSFTLDAFDIGGGFYIHIFGAYYGLSVCLFLTTTKALRHPDNISSYASDLFAFAGTLFLWMMWPSFNSVTGGTGIEKVRGSMNTFLSLTGSTVSTFVVSRFVSKGKFDAIHVQNATLSGGVAMGVAAHLQIFPATALASGLFIGVISTLGFKYLTPFLARYAHIHDTCGINNLHGIPGIYGGLMSIFASWVIATTRNDYVPEYVHGTDQPLIQFAALGITLGIAILSGLATGIILLALIWVGKIHHRNYFHDREFWIIPYDYDEANVGDEGEYDGGE